MYFTISEVLGGGGEGGVEVGAEGRDEGSSEELVDGGVLAAAFFVGVGADVPAVKVQGEAAVPETGDPDGVKAAGDGLTEGAMPCKETFFDSAEAVWP